MYPLGIIYTRTLHIWWSITSLMFIKLYNLPFHSNWIRLLFRVQFYYCNYFKMIPYVCSYIPSVAVSHIFPYPACSHILHAPYIATSACRLPSYPTCCYILPAVISCLLSYPSCCNVPPAVMYRLPLYLECFRFQPVFLTRLAWCRTRWNSVELLKEIFAYFICDSLHFIHLMYNVAAFSQNQRLTTIPLHQYYTQALLCNYTVFWLVQWRKGLYKHLYTFPMRLMKAFLSL